MVCQIPVSIQVKTALIIDPSTTIYTYNFENNSEDTIYVKPLVKILPGHNWGSLNLGAARTLVFQDDESFIFYDENNFKIDEGTYQEENCICTDLTDINCTDIKIYFSMSFVDLGNAPGVYYESSTGEITIPIFPGTPGPAVFTVA